MKLPSSVMLPKRVALPNEIEGAVGENFDELVDWLEKLLRSLEDAFKLSYYDHLRADRGWFFPLTSVTPQNKGEMVFELTSDSQLTVKVKGSDGVVRSTTLTLT